jgi:uncharacterized protein YutE (UPF0331/DUF86 family)
LKAAIEKRFADLITTGDRLLEAVPREQFSDRGRDYWLPNERLPEYRQWMASASNLLKTVARKGSHFFDEPDRLLARKGDQDGFQTTRFAELLGTVKAAYEEWQHGLLRELEYVVAAETFDDFLDHAAAFHRAGKKIEAAVLVSVVLEDALKRIAKKNGVASSGTLDPLIDRLASAGVFTGVKAKRLRAYTGLRNQALHARWDEFDIKDVGEVVAGVKELLEDYL